MLKVFFKKIFYSENVSLSKPVFTKCSLFYMNMTVLLLFIHFSLVLLPVGMGVLGPCFAMKFIVSFLAL